MCAIIIEHHCMYNITCCTGCVEGEKCLGLECVYINEKCDIVLYTGWLVDGEDEEQQLEISLLNGELRITLQTRLLFVNFRKLIVCPPMRF